MDILVLISDAIICIFIVIACFIIDDKINKLAKLIFKDKVTYRSQHPLNVYKVSQKHYKGNCPICGCEVSSRSNKLSCSLCGQNLNWSKRNKRTHN